MKGIRFFGGELGDDGNVMKLDSGNDCTAL